MILQRAALKDGRRDLAVKRPLDQELAAVTTNINLLAAGCGGDSGDARLVAMAQQNLAEQARQNERMAAQSIQIAEASKRLVESDSSDHALSTDDDDPPF